MQDESTLHGLQQDDAIEILGGLLLAISPNQSVNYSSCSQSVRYTTQLVKSATVFIAMYIVPVVSIVGLASNALVCIVVFRRATAMHDKARTIYSAIAIADSMQIMVNSLGQVFLLYGLNLQHGVRSNEALCRFVAFLSALTMGLSNGYAATFATERCLSVHWQARHGVGVSHGRLLHVVAVVTGLQFLEAVLFGLSLEMRVDWRSSQRYCMMGTSSAAQLMQLTSRLCTIYVPCALLLASDVALLVFLLRRRRRRQGGGSEGKRMDTIVSNTKACVLISSLRCFFLLGSIANALQYQSLVYVDGDVFDHCVADLLLALSVLFYSASVLVLASTFYVLLWRVRAFSQGLRALWPSKSRPLAPTQGDTELRTRSGVWLLQAQPRTDSVRKLTS